MNVLRRGTISVEGKLDLTDLLGLDAIRNAWETGADIECKLLFNAAGANYTGFFQVTAFEPGGTHLNASTYSATLENNGPLAYAAS